MHGMIAKNPWVNAASPYSGSAQKAMLPLLYGDAICSVHPPSKCRPFSRIRPDIWAHTLRASPLLISTVAFTVEVQPPTSQGLLVIPVPSITLQSAKAFETLCVSARAGVASSTKSEVTSCLKRIPIGLEKLPQPAAPRSQVCQGFDNIRDS